MIEAKALHALDRIEHALARIATAMQRIEADRAAAGNVAAEEALASEHDNLRRRHEDLKACVAQSLAELDMLLARGQGV